VEHLRRLALRLGVADRVVIEDPLPGYAVYEQIRGFDIGLSTQTNDAVGQCRTTGKLVQYIAAGVYVLASRVGEAARILPERMTVPYHGAWDDAYFARLAERIDAAPSRLALREAGAGCGPVWRGATPIAIDAFPGRAASTGSQAGSTEGL